MSPHELIRLAADDLAEANKLWAEGRADPNTLGEITMRIQMAQAQAIVACAELLHEHLHREPHTPESTAVHDPETERKLSSLLADAGRVFVEDYLPRHKVH